MEKEEEEEKEEEGLWEDLALERDGYGVVVTVAIGIVALTKHFPILVIGQMLAVQSMATEKYLINTYTIY